MDLFLSFVAGLLTGYLICFVVGWMASEIITTFERINRHDDE